RAAPPEGWEQIGEGLYDFGGASAEALTLYRQGWIEILRFGRWSQAERRYREAVAADPDFLIAQSVLARITADTSERDRLYAAVENRSDAVDGQGRLLLHTYQRTLELFARREAGQPFSADDRQAMARRAVSDYERFLEDAPREWSVIIEYMEWVHALDGPEAALRVVEELRGAAETPLYFSYFPAWFEAELGNHEKAAALADDFAKRLNEPDAPQPYFLQAFLAQQRGELEVARQQIEKALSLDPRHLLASRLQAEIMESLAED
ncbi:MAG: hypothetical protein AAGL66_19025, partial [Pseudomonadota bacterium]